VNLRIDEFFLDSRQGFETLSRQNTIECNDERESRVYQYINYKLNYEAQEKGTQKQERSKQKPPRPHYAISKHAPTQVTRGKTTGGLKTIQARATTETETVEREAERRRD
jgi:hypothetical protein